MVNDPWPELDRGRDQGAKIPFHLSAPFRYFVIKMQ